MRILTLSIVIFTLIGCSNNTPINEPTKHRRKEIRDNTISLNLDRDYVRIWCGTHQYIQVLSDGDFRIESDHPEIASVEFSNSMIIINALTAGEATITLYDETDPDNNISLKCYSRVFANMWGEHIDLPNFYDNYVIINSPDPTMNEAITEELMNYSNQRIGTTYYFAEDSDELIGTIQNFV